MGTVLFTITVAAPNGYALRVGRVSVTARPHSAHGRQWPGDWVNEPLPGGQSGLTIGNHQGSPGWQNRFVVAQTSQNRYEISLYESQDGPEGAQLLVLSLRGVPHSHDLGSQPREGDGEIFFSVNPAYIGPIRWSVPFM